MIGSWGDLSGMSGSFGCACGSDGSSSFGNAGFYGDAVSKCSRLTMKLQKKYKKGKMPKSLIKRVEKVCGKAEAAKLALQSATVGLDFTDPSVSSLMSPEELLPMPGEPGGAEFTDEAMVSESALMAAPEESSGMPSWLLPLAGVVILGGGAYYFLAGPGAKK